MRVQCSQCGTRFNLDERLITRYVVKVRCSRCHHVFEVMRPQGTPGLLEDDQPLVSPAPEGGEDTATSGLAATPPEGPPEPEPIPLPARSAASNKERARRVALLATVAGCLLGLLVGTLTLWYFGEKASLSSSPAPKERPEESQRPPLPAAGPEELKNLEIELRDARYRGLVHPKGGQLLVIEGAVKNLTGEPRGPILLKATLMDPMNQPIQELLFYSGTSLSDEELRQTDPEKIKRWLNTPGGRQGVKMIKPNQSQVFTGVFFGVPDNLAEARHGFHIVVLKAPRLPVD